MKLNNSEQRVYDLITFWGCQHDQRILVLMNANADPPWTLGRVWAARNSLVEKGLLFYCGKYKPRNGGRAYRFYGLDRKGPAGWVEVKATAREVSEAARTLANARKGART